VLRSKTPDGVCQETYGHLATHYAIRRMMHDAALSADLVPHRLSFVHSLHAARRTARSQPGLSPHTINNAHQQAIAEILARPLPQRRPRRNPRAIKRKMSNWAVKRPSTATRPSRASTPRTRSPSSAPKFTVLPLRGAAAASSRARPSLGMTAERGGVAFLSQNQTSAANAPASCWRSAWET
jgi:hypothetical protein